MCWKRRKEFLDFHHVFVNLFQITGKNLSRLLAVHRHLSAMWHVAAIEETKLREEERNSSLLLLYSLHIEQMGSPAQGNLRFILTLSRCQDVRCAIVSTLSRHIPPRAQNIYCCRLEVVSQPLKSDWEHAKSMSAQQGGSKDDALCSA